MTGTASTRRLGRAVAFFLTAGILLDGARATFDAWGIHLLRKVERGEILTAAQARAIVTRQEIVDVLHLLVFLGTAALFLTWLHRAHRNLEATGAGDLTYTPGWAVAYFLIPVLNLIRPLQVVRELWHSSEPDDEVRDALAASARLFTPPVLGWWGGLWLVATIVGNWLFFSGRDVVTPLALLRMFQISIGVRAARIAAAVLLIRIVSGIDGRQERGLKRRSAAALAG